jgi:hypothetical protein
LVNARSRSSASESCEAIATSELDVMLNMFSRDDILAVLAFGDIEDALKSRKDMLRYYDVDLKYCYFTSLMLPNLSITGNRKRSKN